MKTCGVIYTGPSYPELHGIPCDKNKGHDVGAPHGDAKHRGHDANGCPVSWFTEEQKKARQAEKARLCGCGEFHGPSERCGP